MTTPYGTGALPAQPGSSVLASPAQLMLSAAVTPPARRCRPGGGGARCSALFGEGGRNVDLVVVGTGEAAQAVAFGMRAAGWSVAVVDSRPFGGTCSLRGVPTPWASACFQMSMARMNSNAQAPTVCIRIPVISWSTSASPAYVR